ncbi:nanos family protein, partial [Salmonella sp. s54836]|uniref:nanos family protein n=1 Tax=Salmonella sp. s54836 TaxID=3159673 RepID=UPI00397F35F7
GNTDKDWASQMWASNKRKEISTIRRGKSGKVVGAKLVCVFCRNNGEDESVYNSHALKAPDGKVTCPVLRAYTCPLCHSSGDEAHTIKYCPTNANALNKAGMVLQNSLLN